MSVSGGWGGGEGERNNGNNKNGSVFGHSNPTTNNPVTRALIQTGIASTKAQRYRHQLRFRENAIAQWYRAENESAKFALGDGFCRRGGSGVP